jgi:predicted amidohydrolase
MASIRGSGYGGELFSKGKLVNPFRIALANIRFPATPEESIRLAVQAIDRASSKGARVICFPECFIPGYRGIGKHVPPPDPEFLARAWSVTAAAAAKANITVVLGTERFVDGALLATALVMNQDGSVAGFQDKVQIDPSEEGTYTPGVCPPRLSSRPLDFRCRDLPRRLALSSIDIKKATGLFAARCRTV